MYLIIHEKQMERGGATRGGGGQNNIWLLNQRENVKGGLSLCFSQWGRVVALAGGSKTTEGALIFVSPIREKQSVRRSLSLCFSLVVVVVVIVVGVGGGGRGAAYLPVLFAFHPFTASHPFMGFVVSPRRLISMAVMTSPKNNTRGLSLCFPAW